VVRDLHASFAWFVVVGNGVAGLWALGAHWLEPLRVRALWFATAVVQVSIIVQVALGVAALQGFEGDPDQFHLFYGFVAVATVGIIYSYRSQLAPHRYLLYGGGGLFLMGLALRSMQFSAA
jgi:hypothetical protein